MRRRAFLLRCLHGVAIAATLAVPACLTSPSARTAATRDLARGSEIVIELNGGGPRASGELLAVTDSSVVLLQAGRVAIVAFRDTRTFLLDDMVWVSFRSTDPKVLVKCRQLSRFPLGITPPVMKVLLDNAGQSTPDLLTGAKPS